MKRLALLLAVACSSGLIAQQVDLGAAKPQGYVSYTAEPQTVKAGMTIRGFAGGSVRPPLRDLGADALARVESVVQGLARVSQDGHDGMAPPIDKQ